MVLQHSLFVDFFADGHSDWDEGCLFAVLISVSRH